MTYTNGMKSLTRQLNIKVTIQAAKIKDGTELEMDLEVNLGNMKEPKTKFITIQNGSDKLEVTLETESGGQLPSYLTFSFKKNEGKDSLLVIGVDRILITSDDNGPHEFRIIMKDEGIEEVE